MESANTKTFLLLQSHFSQLQLPCSDYYTDTKSVLDQTIRILQAMIDVCAENGWLASTLRIIQLMQMVSFVVFGARFSEKINSLVASNFTLTGETEMKKA